MLFPDKDGLYSCETEDCTFKTVDLFEFLDHAGVVFTWDVRVTPRYCFDLFKFLEALSSMVDRGDLDLTYDVIQDTACLFVNASSDELDDCIEESIVAEEADTGIKNIERMLKENGQG